MMNQIFVMGRLTHDPELRRTGSGVAVASFRVAVDRDYVEQGKERETDFFDCVAWRGTGEFVSKYFTKGSMIIVTGRLQNRNWTDKDGNKRYSNEIIADNVYFGEGKRKDANAGAEQAGYAPAAPQGGYAPAAPQQQGGYAPAAPAQQGGYTPAAPQQGGYAPAAPQQGGYAPAAPQQQNGYAAPAAPQNGQGGFNYGGGQLPY